VKLVTYELSGHSGPVQRVGALVGDMVLDLNAGYAAYLGEVEGEPNAYALAQVRVPPSMIGLLEGEERSISEARKTVDYLGERLRRGDAPGGLRGETLFHQASAVRLLAPVPRPNTLRDWLCFEEHLKGAMEKGGGQMPELWYKIPSCYKGNPCTVIGPDEEIWWPEWEDVLLDYECELGMYIGKKGRDIPVEDASRYIAGFTIFNDVSERTIEIKELSLWLGPIKGKDFDHGNVMGPCLVTPDELDFKSITVTVRINGEFQVEGRAGDMYWSWEQLIAHASKSTTLYPGDFFGSGTVGKCCGIDVGRFLQPGDVVELEASDIGVLRNRVVRRGPG